MSHFLWFSSSFSGEQSTPFTVFCIYNLISLSCILIGEKFKTLGYEAVLMCILQQTLQNLKSRAITLGTHGGKFINQVAEGFQQQTCSGTLSCKMSNRGQEQAKIRHNITYYFWYTLKVCLNILNGCYQNLQFFFSCESVQPAGIEKLPHLALGEN